MNNLKKKKDVWQKNSIIISNLSFNYDSTPALKDVSLTVKKNTFLSIIGPNGGGKSTLFKLILGLLKPKKGSILILSKKPKDARKFIGYVPQLSNFNRDFPATSLDVVLTGLASTKPFFSKYSKEDISFAKNALKQVGMSSFSGKQLSNLSGGQVQRILIARALVRRPNILLLDEPVSSVDSKMQVSLYSLLRKLKKTMTIIMVTHDVASTSIYVDEMACLNVRLYHHGSIQSGIKALSKMSSCPVEILAHGVPHRVLGEHNV